MRDLLLSIALTLLICTPSTFAREWTDSKGKVLERGEVVDFDDDLVVLKNTVGRLVTLHAAKLSRADREYLASLDEPEPKPAAATDGPTWTFIDGTKLVGHVARFGRGDLRIQRQNGRTLVNGQPWEQISEPQQEVIIRTVAALEKRPIHDVRGIHALLSANGGSRVYPLEGVVLELEGEEVAVPFFLLTKRDVAALKPGWEKWVAAVQSENRQQEQSAILRTLATEYQRDREFQRRIQTLQFSKDWFDLWEVGLITPKGGELSVVVPARSSLQAQYAALQQYPTCYIGPTRRISRSAENAGGFFGGVPLIAGP